VTVTVRWPEPVSEIVLRATGEQSEVDEGRGIALGALAVAERMPGGDIPPFNPNTSFTKHVPFSGTGKTVFGFNGRAGGHSIAMVIGSDYGFRPKSATSSAK